MQPVTKDMFSKIAAEYGFQGAMFAGIIGLVAFMFGGFLDASSSRDKMFAESIKRQSETYVAAIQKRDEMFIQQQKENNAVLTDLTIEIRSMN